MKRILSYLMILVLQTSLFAGNTPSTQKVVLAHKIKDLNITLDGKLNEAVWLNSTPIKDFTQRDPNEGKPATEETDVWIAYDDENIYVAAKLHDSKPNLIDASLTRRDNYIDSDWFVFYVDPYNDKKSGYYFGVNAGGSLVDGILFNDSWDDNTWDGIWTAKTNIDNNDWTLEMKIPFSQLRFNESDQMKWGVNFQRQIKRNNERSYFVMVPKKESGFVSKFAELDGLNGVKPKQRLEVAPYVVQKAN